MGKLVDGRWIVKSIITSNKSGEYDRLPRTFLGNISSENSLFRPETGRYHLYVSYACPWATRTLIYRKLKLLENHMQILNNQQQEKQTEGSSTMDGDLSMVIEE